jgi:hypothetical protein
MPAAQSFRRPGFSHCSPRSNCSSADLQTDETRSFTVLLSCDRRWKASIWLCSMTYADLGRAGGAVSTIGGCGPLIELPYAHIMRS